MFWVSLPQLGWPTLPEVLLFVGVSRSFIVSGDAVLGAPAGIKLVVDGTVLLLQGLG